MKLLEVPEGLSVLDPLNSNSRAVAVSGEKTAFRLKGKEKLRFRAQVTGAASKGVVTFRIKSKFGGRAEKRQVLHVRR